ncbi:putative transcription factor SEF1 [Fusarium austroafricanum]|uniref:Putative transcription factor SEF1 n=1 Tax=Fusarium austroafricanum TaxID=2364996 RepID=A0A8H4NTE3_9HYPO|nr:putative transcription factor SEF1 [Fusarium austroafricanum]
MDLLSERAGLANANASAYAWNREFFDRQLQKYSTENKAAVGAVASGTDLIKAFLSAPGEIDTFLGPRTYQILELEPFCAGCSMDILESGSDPRVTKPIALLDDRCRRMHHSEPPGGYKRPDLGALSATQLLRELRKWRYSCPNEADAARRLLYVVNPDCWAIMALAATASAFQVAFLAEFFYKYLGSRTSLGIHRPVRGPLIFGLEFHLQFYVWREGDEHFRDPRKKRNGTPLRQSRKLVHLKMSEENEAPVNIYEVQVSCLITGTDEDSWVAHQFVDTYYQGVTSLEQEEQNPVKPDPLTAGLYDANLPIWSPRELEPHTQGYEDFASPSDEGATSSMAQKQSKQQVLNEANMFLQQTIHCISKVIEVWDRFNRRDLNYIQDILRSDSKKSPIPPFKVVTMIEDHVDALKDLQRRAEEQKDLCAALARKLEMQIVMEDNEATARQQAGNEMIKYWTGIGLVSIPFSPMTSLKSDQS